MDELEISGKRYISSRRAAKEHGYHSDYIGQLIRGGKVVGQKVGRSWYVEEASLIAYFSAEKTTPEKSPIVRVEESSPKLVEIVEVLEKKDLEQKEVEIVSAEEILEEVEKEESPVEEKQEYIVDAPLQEEYVVPLKKSTKERTSSLRYVEDDLSVVTVEPSTLGAILEERTATYQGVEISTPTALRVSPIQWGRVVFLLALIGISTFGITFGISSSLAYSNTLKGTTNTASVIYAR